MVDLQLLSIGCKATLILGTITTLMIVTGRRWPLLCTIWKRVGIAALLALPFVVWNLPTIGIPVFPAESKMVAAPAEVAQVKRVLHPSPAPRPKVNFNRTPELDWPAAIAASDVVPSSAPTRPLIVETTSAETALIAPVPNSPVSTIAVQDESIATRSPSPFTLMANRQLPIISFAVAYGFILMVLLVRLIGAWRRLEQLKRTSVPITEICWLNLMTHGADVMRIRRPIELRTSAEVSVPMTFGWRFPVILVPCEYLVDCDPTQREAILIHELTHISRSDFFWQILVQLAASVYWVHPLAWFVRRQSEVLRERLCDRLCARHLGQTVYAQALVQIATRSIYAPHAGIGIAMAQRSSLKRRLNDLSRTQEERNLRSGRIAHLLVIGTAACTLGLIAVGVLTHRIPTPVPDRSATVIAVNTVESVNPAEIDKHDEWTETALKDIPHVKEVADLDSFDDDDLVASDNRTVLKKEELQNLPRVMDGYVMDRFGAAVPDATVTLVICHVKDPFEESPSDAKLEWTATTQKDGSYKIELDDQVLGPHDSVDLRVQAEGYFRAESPIESYRAVMGSLPSQELFASTMSDSPASGAALAGVGIATNAVTGIEFDAQAIQQTTSGNGIWFTSEKGVVAIAEVNQQTTDIQWEDDTEEFNAQVAVTVNDEPILNGTILGRYSGFLITMRKQMLEQANGQKHRFPRRPIPTLADYKKQREKLILININQYIRKKLLVQYLMNSSRRLADKLTPDQQADVKKRIDEAVGKEIEKRKSELKVATTEELESALQDKGTTLSEVRDDFQLERLAIECVHIECPPLEIEDADIREYYKTNANKFKVAATADWQKISVDISPECNANEARKKLDELLTRLGQGESVEQIMGRSRQSDTTNIAAEKSRGERFLKDGGALSFLNNDGTLSNRQVSENGTVTVVEVDPMGFQWNRGIEAKNVKRVVARLRVRADEDGGQLTEINRINLSPQRKRGADDERTGQLTEIPSGTSATNPTASYGLYVENHMLQTNEIVANENGRTDFSAVAINRQMYYEDGKTAMKRSTSASIPADSNPYWLTHQAMTKGSLVDAELEAQVFSVPLYRWSNVIERPNSCCLILVTNRKEAGVKSLDEVKEEIRQTLFGERQTENYRAFFEKIYSTAKIETQYDLNRPHGN